MDNIDQPDQLQPEYDSFGVDESDDGLTVVQMDEQRRFFDYIGRIVVQDEKVVFEEFHDDAFRPVQEVYVEPDGAEERLYSAIGDLVKFSELPETEIEEFGKYLYVKLVERL